MRGFGRARIISALLSAPKVSAAAFFMLLPDIDRREQEKRAYQFYITDALKLIGGLNLRYADLIRPQTAGESPEDIIERVKREINEE